MRIKHPLGHAPLTEEVHFSSEEELGTALDTLRDVLNTENVTAMLDEPKGG